jgi:hypothetical protein
LNAEEREIDTAVDSSFQKARMFFEVIGFSMFQHEQAVFFQQDFRRSKSNIFPVRFQALENCK